MREVDRVERRENKNETRERERVSRSLAHTKLLPLSLSLSLFFDTNGAPCSFLKPEAGRNPGHQVENRGRLLSLSPPSLAEKQRLRERRSNPMIFDEGACLRRRGRRRSPRPSSRTLLVASLCMALALCCTNSGGLVFTEAAKHEAKHDAAAVPPAGGVAAPFEGATAGASSSASSSSRHKTAGSSPVRTNSAASDARAAREAAREAARAFERGATRTAGDAAVSVSIMVGVGEEKNCFRFFSLLLRTNVPFRRASTGPIRTLAER